MVIIICLERFFEINTALFAKLYDFDKHLQLPDLDKFTLSIKDVFSDLADAIENRHQPQPLPPLDRKLDKIHIHLEKLVEQRNIPTHNAGLNYAFVSMLLDRIVNQAAVMHSKVGTNDSN
jgi:hypothetical protein